MRNATVTSMLVPAGTLTGGAVAACVAGEPFVTRPNDKLTGI